MAHIHLQDGYREFAGPWHFAQRRQSPCASWPKYSCVLPVHSRPANAKRLQLTFPRKMIVTIARQFTAMLPLSTSMTIALSWTRSSAAT